MYLSLINAPLSSWLIAFLAQLNPLFGPDVSNALAAHMRRAWSGFNDADNDQYPCKLNRMTLDPSSVLRTRIVMGRLQINKYCCIYTYRFSQLVMLVCHFVMSRLNSLFVL